ncbi:class I SAM-dependent methyltransferase [Shouchella lonarensis]|uniref:Ubiquinone/menaquinone biosynthesis C-methylase UbiE n=1 Tax=Shouchella lonarensis TaxID=1464122 RepID=A0A1G6L6Q8_9BACI|nr:class I SAM-dependent methyltransferase [Shouchella lonarensis]SDC38837.1 Ubiquinone/menaquinone biosynthesis C-methylase UbiE [Shouchella lonarensis]
MRKMDGNEFDPLVDFFDEMAQTMWLKQIHHELFLLSGDWTARDVVDIGCGTGRLLLRGASIAATLTGVDLSAGMVARANELLSETKHARALVGDATNLPLPNDAYDIALSTCVLFLLPDPKQGLVEMARVLRQGGTAVLLNPSEKMSQIAASDYADDHHFSETEKAFLLKWAKAAEHRHRLSCKELDKTFSEAGLITNGHIPVLDGLAYVSKAKK